MLLGLSGVGERESTQSGCSSLWFIPYITNKFNIHVYMVYMRYSLYHTLATFGNQPYAKNNTITDMYE